MSAKNGRTTFQHNYHANCYDSFIIRSIPLMLNYIQIAMHILILESPFCTQILAVKVKKIDDGRYGFGFLVAGICKRIERYRPVGDEDIDQNNTVNEGECAINFTIY